ncbi:MAG: tRNA adenosine(34) deaminase TadA [Clostridia bacterium]|nr:tRNA adenosine(34) deaminase TadA [Clostridia bacterium]
MDYMRMALEEAQKAAAEHEIPVGAVVVKDGEVIARAHNRRENDHDPTAHAELLALREAARLLGDWRLRGCTLYVTLEPCPMCAGAMVMSQLSQCVYGAADEKQGCCGSVYDLPGDPALAGQTKWQSGVLAEECGEMMRTFFAGRRG